MVGALGHLTLTYIFHRRTSEALGKTFALIGSLIYGASVFVRLFDFFVCFLICVIGEYKKFLKIPPSEDPMKMK